MPALFLLSTDPAGTGLWSFPRDWAVIGRSVGGMSENFGEVVEQFRPGFPLHFQASSQIRDAVGSGKAEPLGEVGQSRLRMTAAQRGCDRTRHVGIVTLCNWSGLDLIVIRHGRRDSFGVWTRVPRSSALSVRIFADDSLAGLTGPISSDSATIFEISKPGVPGRDADRTRTIGIAERFWRRGGENTDDVTFRRRR